MNENDSIQITFDSSAYQDLRKLLDVKTFHCMYCNKKINKLNIGGFAKDKKIFCKGLSCLIQFVTRNNKKRERE